MQRAAPDFDDPDLQEALEIACLDAMRGDPYGPTLATRLERAAGDVLRARGIRGCRVSAKSGRSGTSVRILVPAPARRVQEVVLTLR